MFIKLGWFFGIYVYLWLGSVERIVNINKIICNNYESMKLNIVKVIIRIFKDNSVKCMWGVGFLFGENIIKFLEIVILLFLL